MKMILTSSARICTPAADDETNYLIFTRPGPSSADDGVDEPSTAGGASPAGSSVRSLGTRAPPGSARL